MILPLIQYANKPWTPASQVQSKFPFHVKYCLLLLQQVSIYCSPSEGGFHVFSLFDLSSASRICFLKRPPLQADDMKWDFRVEPFWNPKL